jgi:hypothetical protein
MDKELDTLLESGLLSVPDDFTDRVMREVHLSPLPAPRRNWRERLQWLALLGGATLGTFELSAFIFGIWAATTAY